MIKSRPILIASLAIWGVSAGMAAANSNEKLFGGALVIDRDYFIGTWGMGSAEECVDRDTMSFYSSGAWAVTNGGGNPVEVIGTWSLADVTLTVLWSELREPAQREVMAGTLSDVTENSFILTADILRGGDETMHRCN